MNKYLIKLANHLDKKGFYKEADYVDFILRKRAEETDFDELDSDVFEEHMAKTNSGFLIKRFEEISMKMASAAGLLEELSFEYYDLLKKGQNIKCNSQKLQDIEMIIVDESVDHEYLEPDSNDRDKFSLMTLKRSAAEVITMKDMCMIEYGGGILQGSNINELARLQNDGIELFNNYLDQQKLTRIGRYIERNLGGLDQYKVKKVFLQTPSDL